MLDVYAFGEILAVNEFLKNHNLGSAFKVPIGDHLSIAIIKLV
ncbi:hypothetical protein [Helicobacter sp. TUL]|nr:hypothetical protein [Helicobacter sp. TUL]